MPLLRLLVLSLAPSSVLGSVSGEHADTFSDDGVSLLQMSRRQHSAGADLWPTPQQVIISPHSNALHLVGRYDVIKAGDKDVIRFDAAGFEVQLRVTGATEVKVALSQKITGPDGWYGNADPSPEDVYEDGCMLSKKAWSAGALGLFESSAHEGAGTGMQQQGSQPHHFLVYVDGVPQLKPSEGSRCHVCTFDTTESVRGQVTEYTLASGLDRSKSHHIRIVKTSEPDFSSDPAPVPNWLGLHSLILDQGSALRPDAPRSHKIEFLGDSFMSGYCNTCKGTVCQGGPNNASSLGGEPSDTFRWGSFALAWPHLLCEALGAECHATVLSGMGMHCNTHPPGDTNDCSADQTLPQFWQRTLASDEATKWDFKAWTPDAFVIQAASNDHFDDPVRNQTAVLATYEKLFDTVYETYPNVHVFLVCGPFSPIWRPSRAAVICPALGGVFDRIRASGARIDMLDLSALNSKDNLKNCCGHPDRDFHELIKDYVAKEIKHIMTWSDVQ